MSGRLERSRSNRVISGVCGGIGEYLDIDATFVRVVMVILGFGGVGILLYILLLILMPQPGASVPFVRPATDATTPVDPSVPVAPIVVDPAAAERRRNAVGILLVAVGAIFMLGNLGFFRGLDWKYIWPLIIIALGVYLISQRARR
ncbi:MAG TPA: PspC domain-containing protein [Candidatus Limnocylindria bacterium]